MLGRCRSFFKVGRGMSSLVRSTPPVYNTNLVISDFREERSSILKDIFRSELQKTLSYPDVLPNDVYHQLMEDMKDTKSFASLERRCRTEIASIWGSISERDFISKTESLFTSMHYVKEPLEAYGNAALKTKYSNSILEQNLAIGLCLFDELSLNLDPSNINLVATRDKDTFILNGKKTFVFNGSNAAAYFFMGHNLDNENKLTTFLIPSDVSGIQQSPCDTLVGHENSHFCSIELNNVVIPADCVMGDVGSQVLDKGFFSSDSKLYRAARIASVLRILLDDAIQHCHHAVLSDSPLSDSKIIRNKISKCASQIYALESMIYMTTGLADVQKVPDYSLDAISCKLYSESIIMDVVKNVFDILGERSCHLNEVFFSTSKELFASSLYGNDNHFLKLHLGDQAFEDFSTFPKKENKTLKDLFKIYANLRSIRLKKCWNLHHYLLLKNKVHPSFEKSADLVENSIIYLNGTIINAVMNKRSNEEELLLRIGEAGTLVHSMFCTLIRGSRSYCNGLRHADLEKYLCQLYIVNCSQSLERLLFCEENVPPKPYTKEIMDILIFSGEFVSFHPLDKS
ncbi:complex I assembly factor ACAD9, mitochondrial [Lepeophtheirus salmonis]|uniref:complex I assembly factor ACAD9, mitochondrial n=1 Tax=Lepeophtheirus salmonis TaxID=72036 RepID=UPI001AE7A82E|nr:complex I assembly factor ACAD9, mitochondrial-like [Lepeophtheirus salmonis]